METLTSKLFFEQINSNSLKPSFTLKGMVKKTDDDSEVLFARKDDLMNWVKIPSFMIESVDIIKTYLTDNQIKAFVKIHFKTPTSIEGEVFFKLLTTSETGCGCGCKYYHGDRNIGCYGSYEKCNSITGCSPHHG
jgi:hypothetical protein